MTFLCSISQATAGESLWRVWGNHLLFLPKLRVSSVAIWTPNHFPRAAAEEFMSDVCRTVRLIWALHNTLHAGFSLQMISVLRARYPAHLLHDLRVFSCSALQDLLASTPVHFWQRSIKPLERSNLLKFVTRCVTQQSVMLLR